MTRGDISSCSYQYRRLGSQRHWPSSHTSSDSAHTRIDKLESLIITLMEDGPRRTNEGATAEPLAESRGMKRCFVDEPEGGEADVRPDQDFQPRRGMAGVAPIEGEHQRSTGIGEAHWDAILSEVSCVVSGLSMPRLKAWLAVRSTDSLAGSDAPIRRAKPAYFATDETAVVRPRVFTALCRRPESWPCSHHLARAAPPHL